MADQPTPGEQQSLLPEQPEPQEQLPVVDGQPGPRGQQLVLSGLSGPQEQQPLLAEQPRPPGDTYYASLTHWDDTKSQRDFEALLETEMRNIDKEIKDEFEKHINSNLSEQEKPKQQKEFQKLMAEIQKVGGMHSRYGDTLDKMLLKTRKLMWWDFRRIFDTTIELNATMVQLAGMSAFDKYKTNLQNYVDELLKIQGNGELEWEQKQAEYLVASKAVDLDLLADIAESFGKSFKQFQKYTVKWWTITLSILVTLLTTMGGLIKYYLDNQKHKNLEH